jgi:hypothetical protein
MCPLTNKAPGLTILADAILRGTMRPPNSDEITQAQFDREEKLERKRELVHDQKRALEEASRLQLLETDVEQTPTNNRDAICLMALQGLDEAIVATMPGFTPQQAAAVVLVGRRMTYEDAAGALGVSVSDLYLWSRTVDNWQREVVRWRELREVDLGMHLLNGIEKMLAQPLEPNVLVKVLGLLEKVSQNPEVRGYRRAQLMLAAEKLQMQKDHFAAERGESEGRSAIVSFLVDKFQDENLKKVLEAEQSAGKTTLPSAPKFEEEK